MKALKKGSNFFVCLVFNLFINFGWTIPAWILLALHYIADFDIMWFWIAIGVWLLVTVFWMLFITFAVRCGNTPDEPRENKNPYSAKTSDLPSNKRE